MQAPISMISGSGSSKAVAVVALLLGLFAIATLKRQQPASDPSTGWR